MTISPTYIFHKYLPNSILKYITTFLEHPDSASKKYRQDILKENLICNLQFNYNNRLANRSTDPWWTSKDERILYFIKFSLINNTNNNLLKWMRFFNHNYAAVRDSYKCDHLIFLKSVYNKYDKKIFGSKLLELVKEQDYLFRYNNSYIY